ncbi:aminoglycoside phosphotransferase family protein [Paenibacillus mendelii]|uniref:Aminoglycoside phosphotransferase family protein n=1 Tax=Paenibacillus mendelii TaxID=206163 RepID=A0ABV6J4P2_9BACL|nr:aminoglycoside phosphotransferase family protein [Paenibacillus mendelii]MCQ6560450.1 aminoglycoside phosphotransferase family protein [Paenibacillus mendelii]
MEMTVIAAELFAAGVLPSGELVMDKLEGGTNSQVYLMKCGKQDRLVLKWNEPDVIEAEAAYLKRYERLPIVPSLRYVDPANRFLIYEYIAGSTAYYPGHKGEMLLELVRRLISGYDEVEWPRDREESWQYYLLGETGLTRNGSGDLFTEEDHDLVAELAGNSNRVTGPFYHLHGDCGVHNFIFDEDHQLAGVIDPTPLIGQPMYELAFAFCSSSDELTPDVIAEVVYHEAWPFSRELKALYEEVAIALYNRIVTCTYHHPHDLNAYLTAWKQWRMIVTFNR